MLRKLLPVAGFHRPVPGARTRIGAAIDVETTGLDYGSDLIVAHIARFDRPFVGALAVRRPIKAKARRAIAPDAAVLGGSHEKIADCSFLGARKSAVE
ncbi:MAG: hypothetical protein QM681_00805 [Novosphingobium sp.]